MYDHVTKGLRPRNDRLYGGCTRAQQLRKPDLDMAPMSPVRYKRFPTELITGLEKDPLKYKV